MKKVYRLTSVILLAALLSCFMCVPASAVELSGDADFYQSYTKSKTDLSSGPGNTSTSYSVSYPASDNNITGLSTNNTYPYIPFSISAVNVPLDSVTGNVVVVFSYFLGYYDKYSNYTSSFVVLPSPSASMQYTNHLGAIGSGNVDEIFYFSPVAPNTITSWCDNGLTIACTFSGSELAPISNLKVLIDTDSYYCVMRGARSEPVESHFYISSFRVISSAASSAELGELKEISSQIAQSNDILAGMYGDILAVCNAIYERNGSILEAQQLTNAYFEAIIPVLNSISSTTSNIYSLLSQQFSLLISTIESESDDIQSSIDNAVERLIAYFDNVFSSSVNPALPGQSDDITSQGDIFGRADSDYQSSATDRFEAISADFTGFDGSVLSGVALGSTLFQRLWNVLGDYVIIYTFPLTLSICLVVVGRVSRQASRSRGGGGKKKDDSGGDTT